jgi:hypothetical protein
MHTADRRCAGTPGLPCAVVLRLMARSPRRRIPLASVIGELTVLRNPVGIAKTSTDLTPATGARTTRFCRTLQHLSSAAPLIAHRPKPALQSVSAQRALPRPPHSLPNVRDDRDTPLLAGRNGRGCRADLGAGRRSIFSRRGLDGANQVDCVGEISAIAHCRTRSPPIRSPPQIRV